MEMENKLQTKINSILNGGKRKFLAIIINGLDFNKKLVNNDLAKELDIVYNEFIRDYPEFADEIDEWVPKYRYKKVVPERLYIDMAFLIAFIPCVGSIIDEIRKASVDDRDSEWFNHIKDNPVLGLTIIERLIRNMDTLKYRYLTTIREIRDGKINPKDFDISKQILNWFKTIAIDFITYYTAYKDMYDRYKDGQKTYTIYTVVDERRCSQCGELHGTTHKIKDAKIGVNLPPFHNRCRCMVD